MMQAWFSGGEGDQGKQDNRDMQGGRGWPLGDGVGAPSRAGLQVSSSALCCSSRRSRLFLWDGCAFNRNIQLLTLRETTNCFVQGSCAHKDH